MFVTQEISVPKQLKEANTPRGHSKKQMHRHCQQQQQQQQKQLTTINKAAEPPLCNDVKWVDIAQVNGE